MGKFNLPRPKNFALQNSSQRYRHALSGLHLMPFLCHSTKKGRKKGNSAVPSEASLSGRANDVALSLHSCLREDKQIQLLRWRFDGKTPTRKFHARCDCKSFCSLLRTIVCTNFEQNTIAKIRCPICLHFDFKMQTQALNP